MTVADDIREALHDAIDWQCSLIDAWGKDAPESREARSAIRRYKAILKRRYGNDATALDDILSTAKSVGLVELRKAALSSPTKKG